MTTDYLHRYWAYFSLAAVTVMLFAATIFVVATLPPRTIVMATGAKGGANYELGNRYREILGTSGVTVELIQTTGSLQNLELLRDPKSGVSVALIQSGTTSKAQSPGLESLGTVFYEPMWLFYRAGIAANLQALAGKRISIGPEGSGARMLALELVKRTRLDGLVKELLAFTPEEAAEKLISGEIDAAFIVAAWQSPAILSLAHAKDIELGSVARADAFTALYPFLNKLVLPAGIFDLLTVRPSADVLLLAPKASLAVRDDLHPALQHLLLRAAVQIHSQPGMFQKAGQFPAAESIDLPLSEEAQRFYKSGRPFLQNHLPFWLATLIERVIVVLIPLAALIYPVFKLMPSVYNWFVQLKIMRLYADMKLVESDGRLRQSDLGTVKAKLDHIEQRATRLSLPTTYAGTLYSLRSHIDLLRDRLTINAKRAADDR